MQSQREYSLLKWKQEKVVISLDNKYSKKMVGKRLKEFRLSLHLTQKEFAEGMNWDVNTYRKIETGISLLTSDKAQMLHEKYQIDITYILSGDKMSSEDVMKQVFITADANERKDMILALLEYLRNLL